MADVNKAAVVEANINSATDKRVVIDMSVDNDAHVDRMAGLGLPGTDAVVSEDAAPETTSHQAYDPASPRHTIGGWTQRRRSTERRTQRQAEPPPDLVKP